MVRKRSCAVVAVIGLLAGLVVLGVPPASAAPPGQTTVQGTVTAVIFGNPISGALVTVLSPDTGFPVGSALTAANGAYSMDVPSGSGLVLVADPANAHISKLHQSTPVALPDGGTVTVNSQLPRALGGIEGRMTDQSSGNGIAGGVALASDAATGQPRGGAPTDGFGFWVIRNLRSVGHVVTLLDLSGAHGREYYTNVADRASATPVNVVGGALQVLGTQALTARTPPGGTSTLSGTVTDAGDNPLASVAALVHDAGTGDVVAGDLTDATGAYSVPVDAGSYTIEFVDLAGNHLADGPAGPVTAPAVVNAELGPSRGTLAGTITADDTGDPLADVWVFAIDASGILGVARTAADGTYTIGNLPVGEADIWMVELTGNYLPEYHDDRAGRGFGHDQTATPATIAGGATTTVDAGLAPVESVPPTATITTPTDGASFEQGEVVNADYSCADTGGSALDSCVGDVADGSPIETSSPGPQQFSVTATDRAGNTATITHDYTVVPAVCFGEAVTVDLRFGEDPTAGDDVIFGTPGPDDVRGLGGDDLICGRGGEDDLRGGPGRDRIRGGEDSDTVVAGPDGGLVAGNTGDDTLRGGTGKDTLRGGPGADDLIGGAGNDLGDGGPDDDTCALFPGRDTARNCEAIAIP